MKHRRKDAHPVHTKNVPVNDWRKAVAGILDEIPAPWLSRPRPRSGDPRKRAEDVSHRHLCAERIRNIRGSPTGLNEMARRGQPFWKFPPMNGTNTERQELDAPHSKKCCKSFAKCIGCCVHIYCCAAARISNFVASRLPCAFRAPIYSTLLPRNNLPKPREMGKWPVHNHSTASVVKQCGNQHAVFLAMKG